MLRKVSWWVGVGGMLVWGNYRVISGPVLLNLRWEIEFEIGLDPSLTTTGLTRIEDMSSLDSKTLRFILNSVKHKPCVQKILNYTYYFLFHCKNLIFSVMKVTLQPPMSVCLSVSPLPKPPYSIHHKTNHSTLPIPSPSGGINCCKWYNIHV